MSDFLAWPKIPRLNRDIVVTEKIDGTNSCIFVGEDKSFHAQSRKRIITPAEDNFGFARWVHENKDILCDLLGPGYHFGEWWGRGIQRGYGLDHKRFSLFNTHRWKDDPEGVGALADLRSAGLPIDVVPVLYDGPFSQLSIEQALGLLEQDGSYAAEGWDTPEGVVVFHKQARQAFKVLLEGDDVPKGEAA